MSINWINLKEAFIVPLSNFRLYPAALHGEDYAGISDSRQKWREKDAKEGHRWTASNGDRPVSQGVILLELLAELQWWEAKPRSYKMVQHSLFIWINRKDILLDWR